MAGRIAYYGGIVTNGLVLNLDAAKKDSYPGTGTSWRDISGNVNNGTLTNGPTFNTGSGGNIVCDGIDDYIDCGNAASSIRGTQYFTVEIFGKKPSAGSDFHVGAWTATNRQGFFLQWYTDGNVYFGINNNTYNHNRVSLSYTSNFYHFVGVFDGTQASDANKGKIFINGVQQVVTTYLTWITSVPTTQVNFYIGYLPNYGYGTNSSAIVRLYNRALSASEILQNYNATKTRFGL